MRNKHFISVLCVAFVSLAPLGSAVSSAGPSLHRTMLARGKGPRALIVTPKPDRYGTDLVNSGTLATTGPVITPTLMASYKPGSVGQIGGIEIDGGGNAIFSISSLGVSGGAVVSYRSSGAASSGTQNWIFQNGDTFTGLGTGKDQIGSAPVLSDDGFIYIGSDQGNLYRINNSASTAAPSLLPAGTADMIFTSSSGIYQTPKIGPDNSLYVGNAAGTFWKLTPPAASAPAGTAATAAYTFTAQGSIDYGVASTIQALEGEPALDSAGNAYLVSLDSNGSTSLGPSLVGSLYKVRPDGTLDPAFHPAGSTLPGQGIGLPGRPNGGPTLATANGRTVVIVSDRNGDLLGYDTTTGAQVFSFSNVAESFSNPPAVTSGAIYALSSATLYAWNLSTAIPASGAGTLTPLAGFPISIPNGSTQQPIVDAAGTVYFGSNSATLYAYSATGAKRWSLTLPAGTTSGQGEVSIDSNGMICTGTNVGRVYCYGTGYYVSASYSGVTFTNTDSPCGGTVIGVYGSPSLQNFITNASAAYCSYETTTLGLAAATAPTVVYGGGDSCPGIADAGSDTTDPIVGLSEIFATSCVAEGYPLGANAIADKSVLVQPYELLAPCPGANEPQGGTLTRDAPSSPVACAGGGIDPTVNNLNVCAPTNLSQAQAGLLLFGSIGNWKQIGGCSQIATVENRALGAGARVAVCMGIFGPGTDNCNNVGASTGPFSSTTALETAICGRYGTSPGADGNWSVGYAARSDILLSNQLGAPVNRVLSGCGLLAINGTTVWNGTCDAANVASSPSGTHALSPLDGVDTCNGDLQVATGAYPLWSYGHLVTAATTNTSNQPAANFVNWVLNTAPASVFQSSSVIRLCQMGFKRSVDGGALSVQAASC